VDSLPTASPSESCLPGQIAVVTGASGGIGRGIALELAKTGVDVIVHGHRHAQAAQSLVEEIQQLGCSAVVQLADLANPLARREFAQTAWQWGDRIDIWINCAGADVLTGEAAQGSFEQKLTALWQVDVLATVDLSRMIGERMKSRGKGVILNIGWDQAEQGMAGDSGQMFAAVKGAVMAFSRSLAQSLAPEVRVNCLAPGWIRTAWAARASEYWQERAVRQSLRGRWGTPDDVARAAVFLASPAADFITGQIIPINGGFRYE
jgi:3-oxoacyl-[acyl-carrier protein] reductase